MDDEFHNTKETTRLDVDPDVRHLMELLSLLPWPIVLREGQEPPTPWHHTGHEFWQEYASLPPKKADADYYVEKLSTWPRNMVHPGRGHDEDVRRLAEYCLMFFGRDVESNPRRLDLLDRYLPGQVTTGRRWAGDVCETAWRLYLPRQVRQQIRGLASEVTAGGRPELMPPAGAERILMQRGYAGEYTPPALQ